MGSEVSPTVNEVGIGHAAKGKDPGEKTLSAQDTMVCNMALIRNFHAIRMEHARLKSLEQMNLYFNSLESNEKFLSFVNLAEKITRLS